MKKEKHKSNDKKDNEKGFKKDEFDESPHAFTIDTLFELYKDIFEQIYKEMNTKDIYSEISLRVYKEKLFDLILLGKEQKVKDVLEEFPELLNVRNAQGETPIMVSARTGRSIFYDLLKDENVDLEVSDKSGENIVHEIVDSHSSGYFFNTILKRIKERIGERKFKQLLNKETKYGHTPLHRAAYLGLPEIVESLLSYGAVIKPNKNGVSPLDVAKKMRDLFNQQNRKEAVMRYEKIIEILKSHNK